MTLKEKNAAEVIEEKDLSGESLINAVINVFSDKELSVAMGKNAAESAILDANKRIYDCLMELYIG